MTQGSRNTFHIIVIVIVLAIMKIRKYMNEQIWAKLWQKHTDVFQFQSLYILQRKLALLLDWVESKRPQQHTVNIREAHQQTLIIQYVVHTAGHISQHPSAQSVYYHTHRDHQKLRSLWLLYPQVLPSSFLIIGEKSRLTCCLCICHPTFHVLLGFYLCNCILKFGVPHSFGEE